MIGLPLLSTKKDIVEKLRHHLTHGVDTECDVVYLLTEIRKVLDEDDPTHTFGALWMYCHWALHVDLDSPKTTIEFLKRVDLWICNNIAYLRPRPPWELMDEVSLFRDFLYLETLRRELSTFLKLYKLPTEITDVDEKWFSFLAAYAGVIEDGTLSMKSDKNDEIVAVKELVFKKGKALSSDYHVNFMIQWDIALKDGRTLKVELNAQPNHSLKMSKQLITIENRTFVPPAQTP
jgi:hypothetical protein